ncbi:uncharacterized protein Z520_10099 [Fonsecaea multimorphosa CBS 102226]|uniref:BTB domain-containing protein n=1 Tax=Fonsecaea multimorphosa CBS 102226 TaxID=1442371 RepID=A0A0D2KBN0_9EURO|nr:uncharacterized protein Z520_10099 [Fonsecaea multimorphosa CBS 102226]KIX94073.1 hypothetical protein Z520_10099 [Fonsecaea multimorphosa CBS 102226]OAL19426.1 hypothetical protein AYO22_09588 [Fonsecaea multimorphosa]
MSSFASRSSEAPPPSSHDELSQQLRDLNLVVKPNIDDRTAQILSNLIGRIHSDPNFIHYLDDSLAGSKSRELPSNDKHHLNDALDSNKFWGSSNGGDDRATVSPTPTIPCLNTIETPLESEAGYQISDGLFKREMWEPSGRRHSGRFSCRPISVMVNDTEFFVHGRILQAMFLDLSNCLGGGDILYVSDIPEHVFEAALEYQYGRSVGTLEKLLDDELELLGHFAMSNDNWPLLGAIYQISGTELFDKHSLLYITYLYEDCSDLPGFRDYFRESLRKELPKRHENGGSRAFISELVAELQRKSKPSNAMEDVSMVLHELWSASTTTAKSLEAKLAARGNVGSGSDNIDGSGWTKSANDLAWHRDGNQNDLQPSSGRDDDVEVAWEKMIKTAWPAAYRAASDLDSPAPTSPPPPAPVNPPTQSNWGYTAWRDLNNSSSLPKSPPATARGSPHLLHKTSALGRCIHHWMSRQRAENCCRKSFTVEEIATSVGCTEDEVDTALAELVEDGFVSNVESWTGQTLYRAIFSKTTSLSGWEVNQDLCD